MSFFYQIYWYMLWKRAGVEFIHKWFFSYPWSFCYIWSFIGHSLYEILTALLIVNYKNLQKEQWFHIKVQLIHLIYIYIILLDNIDINTDYRYMCHSTWCFFQVLIRSGCSQVAPAKVASPNLTPALGHPHGCIPCHGSASPYFCWSQTRCISMHRPLSESKIQ